MLRSQQGGLLATAAFVFWGAFPFYFKLVAHINPLEVLANRIIWAAFFLFFFEFAVLKHPYSIISMPTR
jgi:chloramphenicol-sensitive protein RarD